MKIKSLQVGALALVAVLLAGCPYHHGRHGPRPGRLPVVVQPVDFMQQIGAAQRGEDSLRTEVVAVWVAA
jgi:hypothetical protein